MDRSKLKTYAPKARRDFIRAVTDRAAIYGLTEDKIEPVTEKGDVAIIAGRAYPISVSAKRRALEDRIKRQGFAQTMEAMAYTWFNRLVAIRFMELHGYLDHGYRVLSHSQANSMPEILEHAEHVDLFGLDKSTVIDLKLDAGKENELYRMLLIAQCNALNSAMPFLFEKIEDETELLLPDNLLHSDSVIRQLVNEVDEPDWQEVEIIGWLYQFYISDKKDEVIGNVVQSEDIPAATQLFTPNWVVKYMVQNTLGRKWLATYPNSALRQKMEFYIEPAEQTPEGQVVLQAITPESLSPEEITFLDPACGSGHILVEAYDIFTEIYQERGYRAKDIPRLILEKNLVGLEIDDRAAQLAAFALMMKGRADDRRIFDTDAKPNILSFQTSDGMDAAAITDAMNSSIHGQKTEPHVSETDIASLLAIFENAKTFGSLTQIPLTLASHLPDIEQRLNEVLTHGDLTHASAHVIKPLLRQVRILSGHYHVVVANPPYMGNKYYSPTLKTFVNEHYEEAKADLYSCFIRRNLLFAQTNGFVGMITIPSWMFLSSFEDVRSSIFKRQTIDTFIHNGRGVFGSDFGSCAFVFRNYSISSYRGSFRRLFDRQGSVASNEELEQRFHTATTYTISSADFARIPGSPVAYWVTNRLREVFETSPGIGETAAPRQGLASSDDRRFVRLWHEVDIARAEFAAVSREQAKASGKKWFPFNKGGEFRKWYGNILHVINWENDGHDLLGYAASLYGSPTRTIKNIAYYFKPGATWTAISSSLLACRFQPPGMLFSNAGMTAFGDPFTVLLVLGILNSKVGAQCLSVINPGVNYNAGDIVKIPFPKEDLLSSPAICAIVTEAIELARLDWHSVETSWGFKVIPVLTDGRPILERSQEAADAERCSRLSRMKSLEVENNRLLIECYGLQEELSPEVPDEQITLYHPDREQDIRRLLSYAIGCIMGRYSLDKPGLIYAQSGNKDFDHAQYKTFAADEDGIVPLSDYAWFDDDATNRVVQFMGAAWPQEHVEENLKFVADSVGSNKGEQPRDTIRRYLAQDFFKDHLKAYKRRPIYWLFSSGKQRAFQCLVYLHRYNEGTLSRMRTEYVIPLQGKISARIEQLAGDIAAATSTAFRSKLTKERDKLIKQQAELQTFDEKLRHYADLRISLDLDDGVKVNYGKFGDLLAEVKAITGGREEE